LIGKITAEDYKKMELEAKALVEKEGEAIRKVSESRLAIQVFGIAEKTLK
jgi:hypothetical protein